MNSHAQKIEDVMLDCLLRRPSGVYVPDIDNNLQSRRDEKFVIISIARSGCLVSTYSLFGPRGLHHDNGKK